MTIKKELRMTKKGAQGDEKEKAPSFSGCNPRIHKEGSRVPVVRWIAGSSPAMTRKKEPAMLWR